MSIRVEDLSKQYGEQFAVDSISFSASKGEVLGFLGPNGAGKTTTMKMITCFIPPTKGSIDVSGMKVGKDDLEIRKTIGYLPEHNPLYKDMYVKEYLKFVCDIFKLEDPHKKIREVIGMTGLSQEQHKRIGELSKGYRQRVGLAQAIIHDPKILILDEPTSGLDPNQLVDIRSLIKNLGKEKTVIFSTHIMQEVQAICDRVVIINSGKLVADAPIKDLKSMIGGQEFLLVEFKENVNESKLLQIPGISKVTKVGSHWKIVGKDAEADLRPVLIHWASQNNLTLLEIKKESGSVEDIFRQLTKN
jgi:ABC-2 type transport system ATP-binding protein